MTLVELTYMPIIQPDQRTVLAFEHNQHIIWENEIWDVFSAFGPPHWISVGETNCRACEHKLQCAIICYNDQFTARQAARCMNGGRILGVPVQTRVECKPRHHPLDRNSHLTHREGEIGLATQIVPSTTSDMIEDTRIAMEKDLRLSGSAAGANNSSRDKKIQDKSNNLDKESKGIISDSLLDEQSGSGLKGKSFVPPADWANAPEFVPRCFPASSSATGISGPPSRSYASVVGHCPTFSFNFGSTGKTFVQLCPYAMVGECRFGEQCLYLHGIKCEFCGMSCLHPFDPSQREKHSRECVQQHEKDMELSFAVARSSDKTCGVCMEVIMEKTPPGEQRFGILPSCNHCFCLSCIRRWRQARQFENKIIRACPECRITSDYVCPSRYWVETKEEKEKLIRSYLESLSKKHCRYYQSGVGDCPFGNKCFYLHALPDGKVIDVGPPRRRVRRQNANGTADPAQSVSIWEFLEQWELQWFEIEDLMDMIDSDEASNWSGDDEDFLDAFDDTEVDWDQAAP